MYKTWDSKVETPEPRDETAPNWDAIRKQLETILGSRTFQFAESQRQFLRYTVGEVIAGRGHLLKEYIIGVEALGRGETFDPRLDPIVRTQARKLRARLDKYYEAEGNHDPMRVEFPKGSYVPCFKRVEERSPEPIAIPAEVEAAPEVQPSDATTSHPTAVQSHRRTAAILLALLGTAAAISVFYVARSGARGHAQTLGGTSIAIMPFVNISDDKEDEFLSDGLTEELINSLAQVSGLQVVARTSVFRFKGRTMDIREIGQKLHVRAVLEGSVRKSGNRLSITVQLNSAADGHHLWTGSYDRDSKDIRLIQEEISRAVTNVLGVRLARSGDQSMRRAFPNLASPSPEAYQNYLKGRYFWNKLTGDGLKTAIYHFERAIAEDPSFARAHTALADSYVMAPQVAAAPPPEVISKIRTAALKALELDSSLGEAHFDLAVCAEYEFDWPTAEREFRRGLELSPGSAVGHLWYAKYLALTGRKREVLLQRSIAAELDPVSPYAVQALAGYFSVMGDYNKAIEGFQSALALEPNFGLARQGLGIAYLLKGMHSEAIAELEIANKTMEGPRRMALLGYAYAVAGKPIEARRVLRGLIDLSRSKPVPALTIAQIYIGLGDKDHAFQWLERAIDERDLNLTLQWDSLYETLRSDPRYLSLLRRMKLA